MSISSVNGDLAWIAPFEGPEYGEFFSVRMEKVHPKEI
jgi:hypothetical protein